MRTVVFPAGMKKKRNDPKVENRIHSSDRT
jgi:hypothetical protein